MKMQRVKGETGGLAVADAGHGEPSEAARLALAEAGEEINGRDGPEPVRYGDWEVKGIASDF
jgi:hypothetical protein